MCFPRKKTPNSSGPDNHGQWLLHQVLNVPSLICNIIGVTDKDIKEKNIEVTFGSADGSSKDTIKENGQPLAYFQPDRPLFVVKLSEPPIGPVVGLIVLKVDELYVLSIT